MTDLLDLTQSIVPILEVIGRALFWALLIGGVTYVAWKGVQEDENGD